MIQPFFLIVPPSLLIILLTSFFAIATPTRSETGYVSMEGSITNTSCAIDIGSQEQTIDMAIMPTNQLIENDLGNYYPFAIRLLNCTISHKDQDKSNRQHFTVTFDGDTDGNDFAVYGEAKGIAIQLIDDKGYSSVPSMPLPKINIISTHEMRLNYALRLVGNGKSFRTGTYYSSVRFKLNYY